MQQLTLLFLGIVLSVIGVRNIRGDISTIHFYNRRKVRQEDVPAYGRAVGTGTLILGAALILSGIAAFWREELVELILLPATAIGLAFILYGQIRYNRGIF